MLDRREFLKSVALTAAAVPLAFWQAYASMAIYVVVAIIWIIPDKRIANALAENAPR